MLLSLREYVKEIKTDETQNKNKEGLEKLRGVFSEYAKHDLSIDEIMKLEKEVYREARATAAVERYRRSYGITGC